ncbi:MAG TPA: hypothetical protein VFG14_03495 [Chthoniobacteraceae bacterium]|nr:hypothetical protein [Chthoniobacteraceae bacterium]
MRLLALLLSMAIVTGGRANGDGSPLPKRRGDALAGTAFAAKLTNLSLPERERAIVIEAARGNVPEFWRTFREVKVTATIDDREVSATYRVAPDYFAIGSDADYFLTPLSPGSGQMLADMLDCTLPTRKMVDDIYRTATLKLDAVKIRPSPAMTTVPVFLEHNRQVFAQRTAVSSEFPLGNLVAGHKKDIVLTPLLAKSPGKVAIYGWHQMPAAKPIQPLYLGHTEAWVDYSHGVRLVARGMTINLEATRTDALLTNPKLSALLSDEGPLTPARFREVKYSERTESIALAEGVECVINRTIDWDPAKPVRLLIYALPNGNTIEQTIGRRLQPGDDWHFDIQHIGAQTRWLREHEPTVNIAIAYLACSERSWPTWRKKNGDAGIPALIDKLRAAIPGQTPTVVLTGHSGGGSLTFGYLNSVEIIPDWIERIAFLDSNYAYDAKLGHDRKLADWLAASDQHCLSVLAYDDASALLNGKPFVSTNGGSWGRSHAMIEDLGTTLAFREDITEGLHHHVALEGRVQFLLKENPTKSILHTRQVELNGFIHAMLTGTPLANYGYLYFGPRVYDAWIEEKPQTTPP